jgi:hypothetical protein
VRELGPRGFTIVITKWWNLGSRISPYNPEYKRHCHSEGSYLEHTHPLHSRRGAFRVHLKAIRISPSILCSRPIEGIMSSVYHIPVVEAKSGLMYDMFRAVSFSQLCDVQTKQVVQRQELHTPTRIPSNGRILFNNENLIQ